MIDPVSAYGDAVSTWRSRSVKVASSNGGRRRRAPTGSARSTRCRRSRRSGRCPPAGSAGRSSRCCRRSVPPASTSIESDGLRPVDRRGQPAERPVVDHRAGEVRQVLDVADGQRLGLGDQTSSRRPAHSDAARRRGRRPSTSARSTRRRRAPARCAGCRVGRGVRDDEVLAAGLADQPRVRPVARRCSPPPGTTGAGTPGSIR